MRLLHICIGIAGIACLLVVLWFAVRPGAAPWTPSGTFTMLIESVPEPGAPEQTLEISIRNVRLHRAGGDTETLSHTDIRAVLDPHQPIAQPLQALEVPTGTYTGFSFELRSPALRNDWQENTAPHALTLAHERVHIPLTFEIVEGSETVLHTRFETARAIRRDETGEYALPVYLPACTVDLWHGARISASEQGAPTIAGGTLITSTFFGQQWDGSMREHRRAKDRLVPSSAPIVPDIPSATEAFETVAPTTTQETTTPPTATTSFATSSEANAGVE